MRLSSTRHGLRNDLTDIRGHADLLHGGQPTGDDVAATDSAAIIGEKTDEAMTRIETFGAVAETLDDLLSEATGIAGEQGSRSGGRLAGVSGRGAPFV